MPVRIKKITKIVLLTLLSIVLLLTGAIIGLFYFLQSESGSEWLTKKLDSTLETELGVEVQLGKVELKLPGTLHLYDVLVWDHHKKEMMRIGEAHAQLAYYNFITQKVTINSVSVSNVNWQLTHYKGEEKTNLGFILAKLTKTDTSATGKTNILVKYIEVNNGNFDYDHQEKPFYTKGIDWHHISLRGVSGRFTYLTLEGSNVGFRVRELHANEQRSGFKVENARTVFAYSRQQMEFTQMYVKTPTSEIGDYLRFDYASPRSFSNFLEEVYMDVSLTNTTASFKDLNYFTPALKNKTDQVKIYRAKGNGTVSRLRIWDIDAAFGENSFVRGQAALRGLPAIDETFMDIKLTVARTSEKELTRLLPETNLPKEVARLGTVEVYKGNFTGFISDFVAYGSFNTSIGRIVTDVNLKNVEQPKLAQYSGTLKAENFDIGSFLEQDMLGLVTLQGKINGKGFTKESLRATLTSTIQRFDFNGYSYNNLAVDGNVRNQFFNGKLAANDPNLKLDFSGTIDFTKQKPQYNFVADIREANLRNLKFIKDTLSFKGKVDIDMAGSTIDDVVGTLKAYNTKLFTPKREYDFDTLTFTSFYAGNYRQIDVESKLLMARLSGNFLVSDIDDIFKATANRYIDSTFIKLKSKTVYNQDVVFDIKFKEVDALMRMFNTGFTLKDSGYARGSLTSSDGRLQLEAFLPGITYGDFKFNDVFLQGEGDGKDLTFNLEMASLINKDSVYLRDIELIALGNNEQLKFNLSGADKSLTKSAQLFGSLDVVGKVGNLKLDSSSVHLNGQTWAITANPITIYGDTLVQVPLLTFSNKGQNLKVIGNYSRKNSYPVRLVLENISLPTVTAFVPEIKGLKGDINGQVLVNDINTKPIVEAALFASPLIYEKDTLGTFRTTTSYDQNTEMLTVEASIENAELEDVLTADGTVDFRRKQALNFDVALNQTMLRTFEPFLQGIFSDLNGYATADMKITGTLKEPKFKGNIALSDAALTVTYLNTRYHFSHSATLDGSVINLKNVVLYDEKNNDATLNGKIDLSKINNIKLALEIKTDNLQVLNTTQNENSLYYGKGYGSGYVSITGPLDNMRMYIKMRTERNTEFYLPITGASNFSGPNYIKFIDKSKFLKEKREVQLTGLRLAMELEVTPDAMMQIIFDPRVGDIIEGRGEGDLRMDISTDGDFNMYGTIAITEGSYRFTAYDVINKNFSIKPGSTISWQRGSPYDATLNVDAAYTVRTNIKPLLTSSGITEQNNPNFDRLYPVEAQLKLRGALMQPDIKLDFEIQEMSSIGAPLTVIQNIKSDEQELNKQVVSLLVLNQFTPVQQGIFGSTVSSGAGSSALNSSVGDLVSSQINYWLSQATNTNNIQVGVDVRTVGTQDQVTFRVSTELFDNRANVDVGYDVVNNNHNAQASYKISNDGNTRAKIFSRSNNNPLFRQSSNTIGIGIFFRKEFDKIEELFRRRKKGNTTQK